MGHGDLLTENTKRMGMHLRFWIGHQYIQWLDWLSRVEFEPDPNLPASDQDNYRTSYLVWVRLECLPYDRFQYNNRVDSWGPPSQSSSQNRGW